jgi:hypothetical protein
VKRIRNETSKGDTIMAINSATSGFNAGAQPSLGSGLAQFQQLAAQNEQFLAATQKAAMIHDTNKAALQKTV